MPTQPLIVGNPVLVVVDIQQGGSMPVEDAGIPMMPGHAERGVDFGRELDGTEGVHCVEGHPGTDLEPSLTPLHDESHQEFHIVKRRYSGFIGTDFEIVLRGLQASTLILIGGLTDVCVHYTFADAHQRDFYVRVVTDCVGGSSQYLHDAALAAMEYLQTGAMRTTEEILAAFKQLEQPVLEGAAR